MKVNMPYMECLGCLVEEPRKNYQDHPVWVSLVGESLCRAIYWSPSHTKHRSCLGEEQAGLQARNKSLGAHRCLSRVSNLVPFTLKVTIKYIPFYTESHNFSVKIRSKMGFEDG